MKNRSLKCFKVVGFILFYLFCICLPGMIFIKNVLNTVDNDAFNFLLFSIIIPIMIYYTVYSLSIILHELGHLIFGLFNKMNFIEFSFLCFSVKKENNRFHFYFNGLANNNIGGFCLMDFQEELNLKNFKLFVFGGPFINFIIALLFLIILHIIVDEIVKDFLFCVIAINLGLGVINIIPFEMNGLDTDGLRLYKIKKDKKYLKKMNSQRQILKMIKSGIKIENIPDNLIYKPDKLEFSLDFEMMNLYIAKLISKKEYDEAQSLIIDFLKDKNISKNYLMNYKVNLIDIYVEKSNFEEIKKIYDNDLFKYFQVISRLEKTINVYILLYYCINNQKNKILEYSRKINEIFNKLDKNSIYYKEGLSFYNKLNEHYKFNSNDATEF